MDDVKLGGVGCLYSFFTFALLGHPSRLEENKKSAVFGSARRYVCSVLVRTQALNRKNRRLARHDVTSEGKMHSIYCGVKLGPEGAPCP